MLLYLFLLPLVTCLKSEMRDYAMSVAGLRGLLDLETLFIDELEGYTKALTLKIDTIESFLDQESSKKTEWESNPEEFVAHPLNSFSLIRRLHEDWSYFELYMSQPEGRDHVENIKRLAKEKAPKQMDLKDAIMAILHLQSYYKLDAANLTKGLIDGRQYNSQLTVLETLKIAHFCLEVQQHGYAFDWYKESIKLFDNIKQDELCEIVYNLKESVVYGYYAKFLAMKKYSVDALNLLNKIADSNVDLWVQRRAVENSAVYYKTKTQFVKYPQTPVIIGCADQFPASTNLTCHYLRNFSHFLTLAPLKVETLSLDPYVVLFHDVIYDSEIQDLKAIDLSTLRHDRSEYPKNSMKYVILEKEVNNVLNNRIKDMTGMQIGKNKDFLLINYGLGGYIKLHSDNERPEHVDRSTSIIFFLSNVKHGGATVFPNLRLSVKPIKGTALLWHNLNDQRRIDYRTKHASCPVLVGSKWTLVKWLPEVSQMLS